MSVAKDLHTSRIAHLDISSHVVVRAEATVAEVLDLMRENKAGAVLIGDDDNMLAGIFTERDALMKVVEDPATWTRSITEFMTTAPQTVSLYETVGDALHMMNAGHYRNAPVHDTDGRIVGNVDHRMMIQFLTDRFPREIYNLPPDPEQIPRTKEGA